jgi:membrane protein
MITVKSLSLCVWRAIQHTVQHDGIEHAGYLAFLGLLALFPFLVFLFSIVGLIGAGEQGGHLISLLLAHLPPGLVAAIRPRIEEITSGPPQGLLTVSILGAVWTSSSAVEGMRTVLNRAYRVATPPSYPLRRLLSIAQLLVFTFVALIGVLLLVMVPVALHHMQGILGMRDIEFGRGWWNNFFMILMVLLLFISVSWVYYFVPNIRQKMWSVVPGAALVVFLWMFAANLLSAYLSHFQQVNLIYGSLGGVIAALIFFYISNVIFIFGAEFNYFFSQAIGMHFEVKEKAAETPPMGSA